MPLKHLLPSALLAALVATTAVAETAGDAFSIGTLRPSLSVISEGPAVRNVSTAAPGATDCRDAVWPNIPAICLSRAPAVERKGVRVRAEAVAQGKQARIARAVVRPAARPEAQVNASPSFFFARMPIR